LGKTWRAPMLCIFRYSKKAVPNEGVEIRTQAVIAGHVGTSTGGRTRTRTRTLYRRGQWSLGSYQRKQASSWRRRKNSETAWARHVAQFTRPKEDGCRRSAIAWVPSTCGFELLRHGRKPQMVIAFYRKNGGGSKSSSP